MNRAITISREYGSGGREIGEKLARRLGIPFYDKELIAMIAKEGNIETSVLEANDEVDPDFDNYSPRQVPPDYQIAMTQRIYAAQATVIRNLNDKGPCVIVGRCADAILPDAVNIFVFSDMENRINRIMSLNPGLTREYYSTTQWGDMDAYDICLNSGLAGVEGCLEAALTYIKYVK